MSGKPNLLTPGCDEEKCSVYLQGAKQGELKRPELPDGFQGRAFKGSIWSERCRGHEFLLMGWW